MSEDEHLTHIHPLPWFRKPLVLFVLASIVTASMLVLVSMALYISSGAAQLDLSRPGYRSVQDKVDRDTFEGFPASGSVNAKTIDDFLELYDKRIKPVDNTSAFSPAALDDAALEINSPN